MSVEPYYLDCSGYRGSQGLCSRIACWSDLIERIRALIC